MRSLIVLAALVLSAGAFANEVYKWTDKDGRVHYGDRPKTGGTEVQVHPGSGPGESDESVKTREAREAQCAKKKAQLETYKNAPSISETDNLGRKHEYSDEERRQFIALQEKKVADLCSPPPPTAAAPAQ